MSDDVARRLERGKCPTCNSTVVIIAPEHEGATGFMLPANEPDHTRALIERDRYRAALEFYADPDTYEQGYPDPDSPFGFTPITEDDGDIAREALKGEGDRSA